MQETEMNKPVCDQVSPLRASVIRYFPQAAPTSGFPLHVTIAASVLGLLLPLAARAENMTSALKPTVTLESAISLLGPGVVREPLPPEPLADPATLLPAREGTWTYNIVGGADRGKSSIIGLQRVDDSERPHLWQQLAKNHQVFSLHVTDQEIVNTSISIPEHNLLIEYTPGQPLLSAQLQPGDVVRRKVAVRAVSLDRPSHERARGYLDVSVTYMGRYRLEVARQSYDSYLLRTDIKSRVGPVHQEDTIYEFYAAATGVVAKVARLDTHALIFYQKDKRNAYLLATPPVFK
jgi:hypothetical protein